MADAVLPVVIVGAGFSGLLMGIELRKRQIPFLIIEKSPEVGGTWFENTYPGAGCDVVSSLYSYSFAQNPDWTRRFAPQSEIKAYLDDCVTRYDLRRDMRLGHEVRSARYSADEKCWTVEVSNGPAVRARSVVFAVGQLNRPAIPAISGQDDFAGRAFHSARWQHDCDLTGKRVAVIGSGASAIQFLPHVARQARQVTLFQRSPNWIIPKSDRQVSDAAKRRYKRFPLLMRLRRNWEYLQLERTFPAFLTGNKQGREWEETCKATIAATISDPALRQALTPDYPAGCKRVLLSDDWFQTLARDNVRVVTGPIEHLTQTGVAVAGENHAADVVIYATGFDARQMLAPIEITGPTGERLHDVWQPHPNAYLGITVSGFPNAFILYGPNTNLGHGSIIFMLECQARYIAKAVSRLHGDRQLALAPRRDVADLHQKDTQTRLARTVWSANCSNWYKSADGVIVNNWGSSTLRYWWLLRKFRLRDFEQP